MLYDVTEVLQECNAVTWFNKDVIKVLQVQGCKNGIIRLQQTCCKGIA